MMLLAGLAGLWWGALLLLLVGSTLLALLQPALATRRAGNRERPPVSLLVPLRRAEEAASPANGALSELDYPAFEILFSVSDGVIASEAKQSRLRHTGEAGLLRFARNDDRIGFIVTTPRPGANPKIANLIEPVEAAAHDLLLIKDAGTVLPPGTLDAMVASLGAGVGLVCAVPVARAPGNFVATIEAGLINTYGGRLLLALSALGGGAGIGAAMLVRRSDLTAAGGLAVLLPVTADDHALARLLRRQGLATLFAAGTVDQILGARRLGEVWRRHLRWAVCRRLEEPFAFLAEPFIGLPAALLAAFGAACFLGWPLLPLLALTLALWPLAEGLLAAGKGWPLAWSMPLAVLLREATMPALWLHALLTRRLAWGELSLPVSAGRR